MDTRSDLIHDCEVMLLSKLYTELFYFLKKNGSGLLYIRGKRKAPSTPSGNNRSTAITTQKGRAVGHNGER